jgi:hypothetical protein
MIKNNKGDYKIVADELMRHTSKILPILIQ